MIRSPLACLADAASRWRPLVLLGLLSLASGGGAALLGCNEGPLKQVSSDAGSPVQGLSAEQAARVVAKVGERTITLGEFAKAIERMDQFDRLKYQSKERRRELLEEMIDVELLAVEAKRLGLDNEPEARDALRQILRDALLADARLGMPTPAQIPDAEVRAYYEAHTERFSEPERRRVAAIILSDKAQAAKVLKDALKIKTATEWGDLVLKNSLAIPKPKTPNVPPTPADLAGDLGIVGPLSDPKGGSPRVPDAVRAAVFKLKDLNEVGPELVEAEGKQFIIRLVGITQPHKRTLTEADRSIRVLLMQEKMNERERALEDELKKKFPVEIDEAALANVKLPAGLDKADKPEPAPSSEPAPEGTPHDGGQ
jgi:hypothetical protein